MDKRDDIEERTDFWLSVAGLLFCLVLFFVFISPATECLAREDRMVEIILDASGSMNNKHRGGESRLNLSKKAVEEFVRAADPAAMFALRAYGHQSVKERHDCADTRLLVGFGSLYTHREKMVFQTNGLKAMGNAPITAALTEAARDFPADFRADMVIVLVSDGRETCKGDPCVLAQSLAKERGRLVIHTIGFNADSLARQQLECIAKVTGGKYLLADDAAQLAKALTIAASTSRGLIVRKIGDGMLSMEGADLPGHAVINAETGEKIGVLSHAQPGLKLPAGIYNVGVGKLLWKSVEVPPGAKTVLRPALLRIERPNVRGHKVVENETGEEVDSVSQTRDSIVLIPGDYEVFFGNAVWPVAAMPGAKITLNPGLVTVRGASAQGHRIRTMRGDLIDTISHSMPTIPLPPGDYTIEIDGRMKPFTVKEGDNLVFQKK
ncbi:MAG: VWA domain-containing protein [Thermodesulfovibrionales bacterium]